MTLLEQCRKFLRYDPETGYFYWQNRRVDFDGKRAGTICTKGYRQIKICGVSRMAHVLAWLMTFGDLPGDQLDHRNEVKDDNRIANLREATNQTSRLFVQKPNSHNKSSGVRGVHRWGKKWIAQIRINDRLISIGRFDSIEPAGAAYREFKALYMEIR